MDKRKKHLSSVVTPLSVLAALALTTVWAPTAMAATIFVKAGATGTATGASWADAFPNLQDGLAAVVAGDELWVAAGTYKPDQGAGITPGDRNATFSLKPDIAVYGGFAGTESALTERNWRANPTILSGDLTGNDLSAFRNYADNSYHVVSFSSAESTTIFPEAILDGLTITHAHGNGLLLRFTSPVLSNLTISHNLAVNDVTGEYDYSFFDQNGGTGISIWNGVPAITNCRIEENKGVVAGVATPVSGTLSSGTMTVIPWP